MLSYCQCKFILHFSTDGVDGYGYLDLALSTYFGTYQQQSNTKGKRRSVNFKE